MSFREAINYLIKVLLYPVGILIRFIKIIFITLFIVIFSYFGILFYEYYNNSYSFARGGDCRLGNHTFFKRISSSSDFIECLDGTKNSDNRYSNFMILMADVDDFDFGSTGHGYIAWMRLTEGEDETLKMHEFQTLHWGPSGDFHASWFHAYVKPWLPFSVRETAERFAISLWRPGGYYVNGDPRMEDANGLVLTSDIPPDAVIKEFVRTPKTILSIAIDDDIYSSLNSLKNELKNRTYSIVLHDCTMLVTEAANKSGLYTPPRLLSPFPAQYIKAIWKFNYSPNGSR